MKRFVEALAAKFDERNVGYWKDDHQVRPGANLTKEIADGITKCTVFVPILSEGYVSDRGEKWCKRESALATHQRKIIIPIQWGKTEIPSEFQLMFRPDTLRAKYDPESDPATCERQLNEICDAVVAQLGK